MGGGGGLLEAGALFAAVEQRFLTSGAPRDLALVHSLGIGDRKTRGVNRFAHEGLVRKVIGGHWVWSPRMQDMARANAIEAYVLPGGVVMQLYREIGAGRPGLISRVGLGTFIDPRIEGGRMNARAKDSLVDVMTIGGEEFLFYKSFPVHVALLRGTYADDEGNISLAEECANLDIQACALAAHNSGGKVIVEVRERVKAGALPAHSIAIPGPWVDAIVVAPDQTMTYDIASTPPWRGCGACRRTKRRRPRSTNVRRSRAAPRTNSVMAWSSISALASRTRWRRWSPPMCGRAAMSRPSSMASMAANC